VPSGVVDGDLKGIRIVFTIGTDGPDAWLRTNDERELRCDIGDEVGQRVVGICKDMWVGVEGFCVHRIVEHKLVVKWDFRAHLSQGSL